ncbi:MAG: thiamine pyrophosphate-binding protein, partial [Candidatus Nanopelagicus sp.]
IAFANRLDNADFDIKSVEELLSEVKKIGIWAGGGATEVTEEIATLSNHLSAPIFTSFAGRGVGSSSNNYLSIPIHEIEAENLLAQCEALLVFGSQLDGMNTKNWSTKFPQKIVLID